LSIAIHDKPMAQVDEFIGIRRATEVAGCAPSRIYRLALCGAIEYRIDPGERPVYRLEDVIRVAK